MRSIHLTIMSVALLGFGSGFSLLFSSHILLTWMQDSGIGLTYLGWISFLYLPYSLSFSWMPVLDYVSHCGGIQRPVLMAGNFILVACLMWGLSQMSPGSHYLWILLTGFCIALISATQDHVIEAYRINILPKAYYKPAINISMVVFRVALMIAGGGGIIFAKYFSWSQMFHMASMIMVVLAVVTYYMPKEVTRKTEEDIQAHYKKALLLVKGLKTRKQFLGTLISHRLGIFWLESMLPVLMIKLLGLSMMDVGKLYQWYGLLGLILGSLIVNYQVDTNRLPLMIYRCLLIQLGLYGGFYILTLSPQISILAKALVFCECALQGVLGTISTLWLIQKVHGDLPAFSTSLWYGLGGVGRIFVGPAAAWVITHLGWGNYMVIGMLLSIIPMLLIHLKWSQSAMHADLRRESVIG